MLTARMPAGPCAKKLNVAPSPTENRRQPRQCQKEHGPENRRWQVEVQPQRVRPPLVRPWRLDPATSAKADAITQALMGEDPNEEKLRSAAEFAAAQLRLQRIRSVRADSIAKVDIHRPDLHEMRRLVALDRYERYAHTKRRRAAVKF
jgi:hypothetical protein